MVEFIHEFYEILVRVDEALIYLIVLIFYIGDLYEEIINLMDSKKNICLTILLSHNR